jgi:hypothetical protein
VPAKWLDGQDSLVGRRARPLDEHEKRQSFPQIMALVPLPSDYPLEEACSGLAHRVYDQCAIQKEISCFAAGLRNQETAVARCAMQRSVIIGGGRVVVSAYGVAGAKPLPFQGGLENSDKPPCDLDETAQRALIACGGGVDQDSALNRLPRNTREHVDALLQCAGRVSAIDRHLAHHRIRYLNADLADVLCPSRPGQKLCP